MYPKPVIGVPSDRREYGIHPFHMVGEKYLRALIDAANVLPLMTPVLADDVDIDELLAQFDGIFLTGSYSNVEPHHYDGEPSDENTLHDPHRDAVTLPLAKRALQKGVPLLAVCRGFQELKDDPLDVQYGPSHPVSLPDGSMLRHLMGTASIMVNSLHEQGVARLADGVSVEAVAEDGLIEAFRVDNAPAFALAVQWHPEWKAAENEISKAIFRAFGDACRERASQRQV
jgi:putative glutamine amidotransferase